MKAAATVGVASLMVVGSVTAASAAPGDTSNASGTYLGGTLVGLNTELVAALGGVTATSDGTAVDTQSEGLNLTVLSAVNVDIPGGIQLPIDFAQAGIVAQYASALTDGSSIGASGLVSDTGAIGTGVEPIDGVAPGPLTLDLSNVIDGIGLESAITDEIAQLGLTVGVTSAQASQAAPAAAAGDYEIAGATIDFTSPTLAELVTSINVLVAPLQTTVNGLDDALTGVLDTVLGPLSALNLVSVNLDVSNVDLAGALTPILTGSLTDPAYPGVSINLSDGTVTVDLDEIQPLNGLLPNTPVLTEDVVTAIEAGIIGLVTGLTSEVEEALLTAIDGITVTGGATLLGLTILDIDTTLGDLLAGDSSGVSLLGTGLTLPGGLEAVVGALLTPLNSIVASVNAISETILLPVSGALVSAIQPILDGVLAITVNNQSTDAGVFSETAIIVELLPGPDVLTLEIANATVGPNAVDITDVAITTPTAGQEFPVPTESDTTDVPVTGTGEPSATVVVSIPGQPSQTTTVGEDGTWTVTFPALPVGDHTATATQTAGEDTSTATIGFAITFEPAADTDADVDVDADADVDADGTDTAADVDADGTDTAADVDADVDADGTDTAADVDADATDTAADVDADGTDTAADVDADGDADTAADADVDADADLDADADAAADADVDGDTDAGESAHATVKYSTIVRATGVVQEVYGIGFEPGETVSGTVHSTPFALTPTVADASGNVTFTFPVDAAFELGAHRVDLVGSVSGELPSDREATNFTVTAPVPAGTPGPKLPNTGFEGMWLGGMAALLLLAGAAVVGFSRKAQES